VRRGAKSTDLAVGDVARLMKGGGVSRSAQEKGIREEFMAVAMSKSAAGGADQRRRRLGEVHLETTMNHFTHIFGFTWYQ